MLTTTLRIIAILALLLPVSASAKKGPKYAAPIEPNPEVSTIYVYCSDGPKDAYAIGVNEAYLANFTKDTYAVFETKERRVAFMLAKKPGSNIFSLPGEPADATVSDEDKAGEKLLKMTVDRGETYFVEITGKKPDELTLAVVEREVAMKKIAKTHLWADRWTDEFVKGDAALSKGEFDEAEACFDVALENLKTASYDCAESLTRHGHAIAYYLQARFVESERELLSAIEGFEKCKDEKRLSLALRDYVDFLKSQEREDEAVEFEDRIEELK